MSQRKGTIDEKFSNVVAIDLNVFSAFMEDRIRGDLDCTGVISMKWCGRLEIYSKLRNRISLSGNDS